MNAPVPTAKIVACPSCGASIKLRALGQSVMVACASCRTQLDVSRPDIRIINAYQKEWTKLVLPLGARGVIKGQKYEVVGAMARTVSGYQWHEYLLFNPYIGFRWLTYDAGHWNFGEMVKDTSKVVVSEVVLHAGRVYRKFQAGSPTVSWVLGEFYWRVAVGDQVLSRDYVSPPYMLSLEKTKGEHTWTLLEYIDRADIEKAFGKDTDRPSTVSPNQPNPHSQRLRAILPVLLVALLVAVLIQAVTVARSKASPMPIGTYSIDGRKPEQQVYGPLTFTAPISLNEFTAYAALDNDWVELDCALVNAKTGESRNFTSAFSFYSGRDSDGRWTEGDNDDTSLIAEVPAGTYNLVVEGAGGGNSNGRATLVHLGLLHDVAPWRNFWLSLLAIFTYPALLLWRRSRFEAERWSESDYAPSSDD
jgi:hypothetical protein